MYVSRAGRWIAEASWPSSQIDDTILRLAAAGLVEGEASTAVLTHRSPTTVGVDDGEWCPYGYDADLPLDQRGADGQSLGFDTEPLAEPLEILGAPIVTLDLTVDQPRALVAVRLNDVAPNGESTRVTFGLLNLTHRESHEHPSLLEPGKRYRVCVKLNDVAHQFSVGHRIRLAISTNWWPLVWPSPVPVTLNLITGESQIVLPTRPQREEKLALRSYEAPACAPPAQHSAMAPYQRGRAVTLNAGTGETVVEASKDRGRFYLHEVDIECSSSGLERNVIRDADPLSSVGETDYAISLKRADWEVRTESHPTLSSTADEFLVSASMDAYEGTKRVFAKTWSTRIARKFI